jgi:hypothetical protein
MVNTTGDRSQSLKRGSRSSVTTSFYVIVSYDFAAVVKIGVLNKSVTRGQELLFMFNWRNIMNNKEQIKIKPEMFNIRQTSNPEL